MACNSPPPQVQATDDPRDWALFARVNSEDPGALPDPLLLDWAKACPRTCIVEKWGSDEETLVLRILPRKLEVQVGPERLRTIAWQRKWERLGPLLQACLGDPLRPHPDLRRILHEGPQPSWQLSFDNFGPCELNGGLRLPAEGGPVDVGLVQVEGQAWSAGGKDRAKNKLLAWFELQGRAGQLDEESRAWIEVALTQQ